MARKNELYVLPEVVSMTKNLVSVIVPCYNHENYVQECIQSIIDQDYPDIELIIIDDGSADESVKIIKEMILACEKRFSRFEFRVRANKGLCATLNEGVNWCQGKFISPLASDDILMANRFSRQVSEFELKSKFEPNLVAVYSGVELISQDGSAITKKYGSGKFCGFEEVIFRTEFLPTPTFMALKEKLIESGGFNQEYKIEDFYIRLKLTNGLGKFFVLPDILVKYRRHDGNLSKKSDEIWIDVKEILDEYKGDRRYSKAMAMSMMVQAHDYQSSSQVKGIKFLAKAVSFDFRVIFTKSFIKFLLKLVYRPKSF